VDGVVIGVGHRRRPAIDSAPGRRAAASAGHH
jgi:hypothetical protein